MYNQSHKEINGELYKKCSKHSEYFPNEDEWISCNEEYFYKNKSNHLDGLHPYCKECSRKKTLIWKERNPEKNKELKKKYNEEHKELCLSRIAVCNKIRKEKGLEKKWQQENKDKIKQYTEKYSNKSHKISTKEWKLCKEYFNDSCAYCGISNNETKVLHKQYLHKEHVDHNGASDLSNCIPSCRICNSEKHTFVLEEWYNKNNTKFNKERLDKIHKWLNEDYKQYIENNPKLPYKITRKKIEDSNKFKFELWSLDENEKPIELKAIGHKRKDVEKYIPIYFNNEIQV